MIINPVFFPKTTQVMAVICCLGLGCSGPKTVQIKDTTPAVTPDKQSGPKTVQIEDTTPAIDVVKQTDKSTEVEYEESKMDPVKKSQKQKGVAEIIKTVEQNKEPTKVTQAPVPKAEPSRSLSYHEVSAVFKGYTYICSDMNSLYGVAPRSNFGGSRCRKNVLNAYFQVSKYKRYKHNDPAGERKQKWVLFNAIPSDFQAILDSLTLEDAVLLHWNHTKGDARKYGNGSIGGFLIQREISLLKCLKTCGTGVVAEKPTFRPFLNKQKSASVNFQIRRVYLDNGGSLVLNKGSEKTLTHQTIRKFLKKSKLKKRMEDCQQKILASRGNNPKVYGKLFLGIGISKKTPLEIKIKNIRMTSKEMRQCTEKVLKSIKPFKHSLSFKAKAVMHVNFSYR